VLITLKSKLDEEVANAKYINRLKSLYENISINSDTKTLVDEAKYYVQLNYKNIDMSAETLAKELHVSPAYFSTMFKKQEGVNFVSFVTEVRMNRAKILLENTEEKTYVIAEKVGYSEPNYFSYCFKKHVGESPTKYREIKRTQND
jgi:two-component system response regulator YesN